MASFFERKIYPMEPGPAPVQPGRAGYEYQVKWDGVRMLAFGNESDVRFQGRNLRDKTGYYPELEKLPAQIRAREYILDGEIITLKEGRPSFYILMQRESAGKNKAAELARRIPVFYMVFDLLYRDGAWITGEPWEVRQELLHQTLEEKDPFHVTPAYQEGDSLLQVVEKHKMEGMVAKKLGSPYVFGPRKTAYWLKMKIEQSIEAVVGGVALKDGRPASLLLGLDAGNETLQYIGRVSAGLGEKELNAWYLWGLEHRLKQCPFSYTPKGSAAQSFIWIVPENTVQVRFSEWTPALRLRAPRL